MRRKYRFYFSFRLNSEHTIAVAMDALSDSAPFENGGINNFRFTDLAMALLIPWDSLPMIIIPLSGSCSW